MLKVGHIYHYTNTENGPCTFLVLEKGDFWRKNWNFQYKIEILAGASLWRDLDYCTKGSRMATYSKDLGISKKIVNILYG